MAALKGEGKSIEEIYKYTNDIIFEEEEEDEVDSESDGSYNPDPPRYTQTPVRINKPK